MARWSPLLGSLLRHAERYVWPIIFLGPAQSTNVTLLRYYESHMERICNVVTEKLSIKKGLMQKVVILKMPQSQLLTPSPTHEPDPEVYISSTASEVS